MLSCRAVVSLVGQVSVLVRPGDNAGFGPTASSEAATLQHHQWCAADWAEEAMRQLSGSLVRSRSTDNAAWSLVRGM